MAAFLLALVGPLVIKALIALSIGTVTFTGVTIALNGLINMATSNWSSVFPAVLQLASLGGVPEGIGIVTGAMVARVGIWAASSASKFVLNK